MEGHKLASLAQKGGCAVKGGEGGDFVRAAHSSKYGISSYKSR